MTSQTLEITSGLPENNRSPFEVGWQKCMMWLFLIGDALLFAGFLTIYGFVRLASPSWPDRGEIFDLRLIGAMTVILITSGATMGTAVEAARNGRWKTVVHCLLITVIAGAIFLGMQAYEWIHFIHQGATLSFNPWGPPLFSASFFIITGFHAFHVLSGLVLLLIVAWRSHHHISQAEGLELAGLYWAFVDIVWVFIFPLFYLI